MSLWGRVVFCVYIGVPTCFQSVYLMLIRFRLWFTVRRNFPFESVVVYHVDVTHIRLGAPRSPCRFEPTRFASAVLCIFTVHLQTCWAYLGNMMVCLLGAFVFGMCYVLFSEFHPVFRQLSAVGKPEVDSIFLGRHAG